MRIGVILMAALLLTGCATHYSSLREKTADRESKVTKIESRIIIAEPSEIMPALLDVVYKEFHDVYIHIEDHEKGHLLFTGKGFGLRGNVMVTIMLKKASGIATDGTNVSGYYLDMSSTGSGFNSSMFPGYAVDNINEVLPEAMKARGLIYTTVTEVTPY